MILGNLFLGEKNFSPTKLLRIFIAFGGAGLILIRGETGLVEFFQAYLRGYALVGVSLTSMSIGYIYANKFLVARNELDVINIRILAATIFFDPNYISYSGFRCK